MVTLRQAQPNVLFGVEAICKALKMGEVRLRRWRERGLPIKIIDGTLVAHKETLEEFIRAYLVA